MAAQKRQAQSETNAAANKEGPTAPAAKKRRTQKIQLSPEELQKNEVVLLQSVMQHLDQNLELGQSLYEKLYHLLQKKLDHVYASVHGVKETAKQGLIADMTAGAKVHSMPTLMSVTGSVGSLVSDVISANKEQKQLFQDMQTAKLIDAMHMGTNFSTDKVKASLFAVKVDHLVRNLQNLHQKLDRQLRMTHGKGLTLEHGKDLVSKDHQKQLLEKCKQLEGVVGKQIAMNLALKNKLTQAAKNPDAPEPHQHTVTKKPR